MTDQPSWKRAVTSHDVARRAGVSRAAVSRTFTPNASVSEQTRQKVMKAAEELGYRVNFLARSLINQRSDLVGLVAAGLDNPFRTMQIDQLTRGLLARDLRPILLPTSRSEDVGRFIEHLLQYSVSGVIITSDAPPTQLCEECASNGIPIVLINKGEDIAMVDRVVNDDAAAGRAAADYFFDAGHRRLAVMAAPHLSYTGRQRRKAFIARSDELGAALDVIDVPINDYQSGFESAETLDRRGVEVLFCVNDYMACGVVDGLARLGRDRSEAGVKIIGHDDIPQAAWGAYQLTTFAQPCDLQANAAIDFLASRIADPSVPARLATTPIHLIQRASA
ncbi:LacI family transcriptional regulator [Devosia pacifica]|uniref:LacI family transcriptional regulator n=1 Tax=Devosia pacifica TaxID=1335967 RepID=A0A918S381_9HYPH|nr:LacI family DNA-binding transcriptional regulator [Devosia pacifica]GHA21447.1 LacI family transcriptional regulator [Devosia pacifica]